MPAWICAPARAVPRHRRASGRCPICEDERQYVGWPASMDDDGRDRRRHTVVVREEEPDLIGIGVKPPSASASGPCWCAPRTGTCCGTASRCSTRRARARSPSWAASTQSACRIRTSTPRTSTSPTPSTRASSSRAPTAVDPATLAAHRAVRRRHRPGARRHARPHRGHFDGAAVLHWPAGSDGRGALLTGDTITVVQDRDWVSFMWSYPNLIPLAEARSRDRPTASGGSASTASTAAGGDGCVGRRRAAIRRSADRYIARCSRRSPYHRKPGDPGRRSGAASRPARIPGGGAVAVVVGGGRDQQVGVPRCSACGGDAEVHPGLGAVEAVERAPTRAWRLKWSIRRLMRRWNLGACSTSRRACSGLPLRDRRAPTRSASTWVSP